MGFVRAVVFLLAAALTACHKGNPHAPAQGRDVNELSNAVSSARAAALSWKAQSIMDYWLGDDRVKGEVWIMGRPGAKLRMNALSPAGGSVLSDLACDGQRFAYEDRQNNCVLAGPCDQHSIAHFLRVSLAPDEFYFLSLAIPPLWADAEITSTYDQAKGRQIFTATSPAGKQVLTYVASKAGQWDLVRMEVNDAADKSQWSVDHKDFAPVSGPNGTLRLPMATRFQSPGEKSDLLVEWQSHELGPDIADDKFHLELTPGLPTCGQQ